ncbi:hypothetical protein GCWU000324_01670 [Kingella oralis ATCC 51147]|uniref:ESPR domain-containing protein n=1 Tax=Kingella oralis ATCC 51147 TaxID=629741 RepID=C4GL14_9NEIS|nr:hypothetical protein GCWU000324_01670 [Kingella oralis ATCC 51147]
MGRGLKNKGKIKLLNFWAVAWAAFQAASISATHRQPENTKLRFSQ